MNICIKDGKILIPAEFVRDKPTKDELGVHWFRQYKCWALYANELTVRKINKKFGSRLVAPAPPARPTITFDYKTEPKEWQLEALTAGLGLPAFAYLLDPGLGKSWIAITEAQILWSRGMLHQVLVVCPLNAVGTWAEQIMEHGYGEITAWKRPDLMKSADDRGPRWAIIHKDALVSPTKKDEIRKTTEGFKWAQNFLNGGYTMMVIDESTDIAGHDSWRTAAAMALRNAANYRRILNGTFIGDKPLEAYSQLYYLDPQIVYEWSYYAFQSHFAIMGGYEVRGHGTQVLGYRNLDELSAMIDSVSYKKRKSEVDLPPKTYLVKDVVLSEKTKKVYNNIVLDIRTELDNGVITADQAMTKAVKLRQVTGGSVFDDEHNAVKVGSEKINECMHMLRQIGNASVLIWCQFRPDIARLGEAIQAAGYTVAEYHGDVKPSDRDMMKDQFNNKEIQVLIIQNDSGYRAITLNAAEWVFIFSNPERLLVRTQLEDRPHRIGQSKNVTYVDFIVRGSYDEVIKESHAFKKDVADYVMWKEGETKNQYVKRRVLRLL
ncbi:MAG: DEAD/DEAH box helicase [Gaiellales bacterium]|nr:MAG: DEAD/DEAH box helicase [Gaiellales bacterium]